MNLFRILVFTLIVTLVAAFAMRPDQPEAISPMVSLDSKSPRSTVSGFLNHVNQRYLNAIGPTGILTTYMQSGRLYANSEEEALLTQMLASRIEPSKFLDLSSVPDASRFETIWRLTFQLKEILDRIPLPPEDAIPDLDDVKANTIKSWKIPGTEITISSVDKGPREGDFLFSPETVANIPAYYAAIKDAPRINSLEQNYYDLTFHHPSGVAIYLRHIIPPRWILGLPSWTQTLLLDQPLWRWMAITVMAFIFGAITITSYKVSRYLTAKGKRRDPSWELLPYIALVIMSPFYSWFFSEVLRVSGVVYSLFNVTFWATFFITLTWLVWKGGQILAEAFIESSQVISVSVDGQIVRLCFRLLSLILSLALLTEGANRLGMPAYSIWTGLGIGGLAVALAAQQTLANLLGSLIIMFEKPFRVGHWIKAGDIEGFIEDIGFRSTRIRTLQNSVVSVPSSELVNESIENMTTRKFRIARRELCISLNTPVEKVESMIREIGEIISAGPGEKGNGIDVVLKCISNKGYEILFEFKVHSHGELEEFREQQRIFLEIAHAAEREGVQFSRYAGFAEVDSESIHTNSKESSIKEGGALHEPLSSAE